MSASSSPLDVLVEAIAESVARRIAEYASAAPPNAAGPPPVAEAEWLNTAGAARYLGLKAKTLAEWRERGEGPPAHRVGRRAIRYARRELDAFARASRTAKEVRS